MSVRMRRLPRSNAPQPQESLSGYLLNLAHRLQLRPKDLVVRTGLKDDSNPALLDLQYAVTLPEEQRRRFAFATGLTDAEVLELTIERHLDVVASSADRTVARTLHSNLWLNLGHTRYCPECLAATDPATPEHAVWRVNWLTPWAVACVIHRRLLLDTCPECQTPTGFSGRNAFRSTIPNLHRPVTHPAACRAQERNHITGLCDTRLDQVPAPAVSDDLVSLQSHLDQMLGGEPYATSQTLGTSVTPAQRLRDLRLVIILLQLTPADGALAPIPQPPRVLTQPPTDTATAARLLQQAAELLNDPTRTDGLQALSKHALRHHKEAWKKAVATGSASPALDHALKDVKNGIVDPAKLLAYATIGNPAFTASNVPAYLDQDTYDRHFADIPDRYQRPIRRCVPIALVRLISNHGTNSAGRLLGYDASTTQAACARASDAFDTLGLNHFRQRVTRIAAEHNTRPTQTDYARLRDAFTSQWTIPDDIWVDFQDALLSNKLARADTPWARRRPAYDTWVWELITQGDLHTAPMIRTMVNGRLCTNGVATVLNDIQRRTPPAHQQLVHEMAQHVRACIFA